MGIRVALGAPARGIVKEVLKEGLSLTLLGLVLGVALTLPASRFMSDLVFQVKTWDPSTYVLSGALLTLVALAACGPPAFKAARTDPMEALRNE
jgi:putative ABC transport system permease protein